MICCPNFKINIGLYITAKRKDGFHDIETIFYPIDNKTDKLEIVISEKGKTHLKIINSAELTETENNLCLKAYRLLKQDYCLPEFEMILTKNIPIAAGLGGGSSDAAFTLKMINELCELNISSQKLKEYAAQLGSDVAFFIENRPAFATGRGEIMEIIDLDLSHKKITVVKPNLSISTAEAYALIEPKRTKISLKEMIKYPVEEWKHSISNDFEKPLFEKYPLLQNIKTALYEKGADYVSLSGSGSALFAIADHEIEYDIDHYAS